MSSMDLLYEHIADFQVSNNLIEYPINLPELCLRKGWELVPYDVFKDPQMLGITNDGLSIYKNGRFYILYNKYAFTPRLFFTVAHEIGHILLGHHFLSEEEFQARNSELEREADIFAANLLCPALLVDKFSLDAEQIQRCFGVSRQCAETRTLSFAYDSKKIKYDSAFARAMILNFIMYPPREPAPIQKFAFVMNY